MKLFFNINKFFFQEKEKKYFILIFFGILITTILELISIASIIPVFNIIILEQSPSFFNFNFDNFKFDNYYKLLTLSIFIIIFIIKNIFIAVFNYFFTNFIYELNIKISNRLFISSLKQNYLFFLKANNTNFLRTVTDDVMHASIWLLSIINIVVEIFFIFSISIYLLWISHEIFLLCFGIFIFSFSIYFITFKERLKKWSIQHWEANGKIKQTVIEGISGIKDVIIYHLEDYFYNRFKANIYLYNKTRFKFDFLNNIQKYWLETITVVALTISLIFLILFDYNINNLIPVFGVFVFALFRLLTSFNRTVLHLHTIKFYYSSILSIINNFIIFEASKEYSINKPFEFKKNIEFKNLSFFYEGSSEKILKNINFEIKKGESIGIIGKNGSGKSTLLNLISGLIKTPEGEILIDGSYNLYSNRKIWYKIISYVQQNIFILDSNIKINICLEDESKINHLKFNKILHDLEINKFFKDIEDDSVGSNGTNLSGGQKQIISLARALYKDSQIIILDEPSSALDLENSTLLKKILLSLKKQKTIIMVTHDKDFYFDCFDKVIEIDCGQINFPKY
jgi:ABC-type bacteriocin/lantibiotic exporter with double-glycine peptidase domain